VQQRLQRCGAGEITGLLQQREIAGERDRSLELAREIPPLAGIQQEKRGDGGHREGDVSRRKQPLGATKIKTREAEMAAADIPGEHARDQESRDHEEDVHAQIARSDETGAGVLQDHQQYRQAPQGLDVCPERLSGQLHRGRGKLRSDG
jgi:hypothetical protein